MVNKLSRKNVFSKRQPFSEARKQKQREYLVKARLARVNKTKTTIKCLTNREISNKLQEMGNGPTNTDETVMDTIDVLNEDIQDVKMQLDENIHDEMISILTDQITDLRDEIAHLRDLVGDLDGRMDFNEEQINTLIEVTID